MQSILHTNPDDTKARIFVGDKATIGAGATIGAEEPKS
jgi:acetyltransferase-like isoleucine patch superfamily enzyme